VLLCNTSQVDAEMPDLEEFPAFSQATRFECELGPGDALYIPPGWWHHVRSLSVSFSVSHWFGS
jgi:ribosomal protein L16 Arg81 hydroxylase